MYNEIVVEKVYLLVRKRVYYAHYLAKIWILLDEQAVDCARGHVSVREVCTLI